MGRRQRRSTMPDPVFAFLRGELVEINEHIPDRRFTAKACERGCSPEPARMFCVLPGIEYPAAAPVGISDVVGPVEDRFEHVAVGGELGIAETPQGRRILRLDPCDRATVLDLFKPEIGIIIGRFNRWTRIEDRHGASRMTWRMSPYWYRPTE